MLLKVVWLYNKLMIKYKIGEVVQKMGECKSDTLVGVFASHLQLYVKTGFFGAWPLNHQTVGLFPPIHLGYLE